MKKCCERCKYYEEDYEISCRSCRVGDGAVNYSNFEFNDELRELMDNAKLGKALLKALNEKKYLEMKYTNDILTSDTVDALLRWAEKGW